MKPVTPIHGAEFVYTDSWNTDIRKRFDRIRNEQEQVKKFPSGYHLESPKSIWWVKNGN